MDHSTLVKLYKASGMGNALLGGRSNDTVSTDSWHFIYVLRRITREEGTVVTEEAKVAKEAQPATQPVAPEAQKASPYAFYVVTLALVLVSLVAFSTMLIFRGLFENATDVTAVLSSLFAVVGTLVGTYFGIKASSDTSDKARDTIERANEVTNRALAELDPEAGRRVVRDASRTEP